MTNTQNEPVELLPCPLCGLRAELWRAHPENPKRKAWIACTDKCCIMTREYLTDEEAIAAWNTRPASSAVVDALVEDLMSAPYEWHGPFGKEKHRIIPPTLFDRILSALDGDRS